MQNTIQQSFLTYIYELLYPANEHQKKIFVGSQNEFGLRTADVNTYKNKRIKRLKTFLKNQKNICMNSPFSRFLGYIYNLYAKTVDLPEFINVFTGVVYAKVSSHIGVKTYIRRCML